MTDCQVMRRKLVTHSTLNLGTGRSTIVRKEWVTEPCNIPLFGEPGPCRSCREGWASRLNYPVTCGHESHRAVSTIIKCVRRQGEAERKRGRAMIVWTRSHRSAKQHAFAVQPVPGQRMTTLCGFDVVIARGDRANTGERCGRCVAALPGINNEK